MRVAVLWAAVALGRLFAGAVAAADRRSRPVPEFRIDLDRDPEERFREVALHFEGTLQKLYDSLPHLVVGLLADKIAEHRGPERDEELQGEIRGYAKYSPLPLKYVQVAQLLYELQTIMVPFENHTWPWGQTTHRTGEEFKFGCTGVIARSNDTGTVIHARNLDFSFAKYLQDMTYNGVFVQGGKELFTAQMVAAYSSPLTAMRRGSNGYTVEINTRYPPKSTNIEQLMSHLFKEKRETSGWIKRQILKTIDNYEDAVKAMSTRPYASTEYNIISGNQKGVILARDPDSVYHTLTLGPNKNDYIIMTNFDYWDHDFKEWFDPTSHRLGHSRRVGAERLLNKSQNINYDELLRVMNDEEVQAKDTIYQSFMNVQEDTFRSNLPPCTDCPNNASAALASAACAADDRCLVGDQRCCGARSHVSLDCAGSTGRRCGCLPDGACRVHADDATKGDEDCCSSQSHASPECPAGRRCGAKPRPEVEYV